MNQNEVIKEIENCISKCDPKTQCYTVAILRALVFAHNCDCCAYRILGKLHDAVIAWQTEQKMLQQQKESKTECEKVKRSTIIDKVQELLKLVEQNCC